MKFIKRLPEHINYLKELIQTFKRLNFSFDIPLEKMSKKDLQRIESLKNILMYQDYSSLKLGKNDFIKVPISGLNILLAAVQKDEDWIVFNAFDLETLNNNFRIVVLDQEEKRKAKQSPYVILNVQELFEMCNFDLDVLEKSLLQFEYDTDFGRNVVNKFLLNVINYYDIRKANNDFLEVVKSVYEYLLSFDKDNDNYFINLMQVIKRQRDFNNHEKSMLVHKKNNVKNPEVLCGYFALLGSQIEFDLYFNSLSPKTQKSFKAYPIYRLVKEQGVH